MNFETFFRDNEDWVPYADLVVMPPSPEEIKKEFKKSRIDPDVISRCMEVVREGGGYVTRGAIYVRIRREESRVRDSDRWATMLCLQAPPGLQTTDTFWSGRKTWVEHFGEEYANNIKAQFAKKGINLTANQEYMPELVRPGFGPHNPDPEAIVPFGGARSHIKKLCESRGWACILPGQEIQGKIIGASESDYSGPAREVVTASGKRISVTCNHPIVTDQGLVAAGELKIGDNLLGYVGEDYGPVGDNEQNAPALAEDVFRSLSNIAGSVLSDAKLTCDPLDLHGDAKFFNGYVETVGTYSELALDRITNAPKGFGYGDFIRGGSQELSLAGCSPFDSRLDATLSGAAVAEEHCDLAIPLSLSNADPAELASLGPASQIDTILNKLPSEALAIGAGFTGQILQDFPGKVSLDKIIEIRDFFFSGHVYDFHSPYGWIIANGIFASNCEGAVTAKHRQPEVDPLDDDQCTPMGEDLIRTKGRLMMQDNPGVFAKMNRQEVRAHILEKHGPSKTKGRIVDVNQIGK